MTIVVFTAFLRSTRGTAGTNQWFNTCSSQQWYDATSGGLCLNASKVVSVLEMDDSNGVTVLLGKYYFIVIHFICLANSFMPNCLTISRERDAKVPVRSANCNWLNIRFWWRWYPKSIVNDFGNMLGVVSGRAAAILRSTETYPMLADLFKIGK